MTQNLAPGPATQLVGTTLTQAGSGASYPVVSGSITSAASTITTGNIGLAGNVTVYIYGTYAGVNANFEISPDNTNWFPAAMNREDIGWGETTTGVLPANTVRSWTMGAPGLLFFRVKATAWTSGTANVAIIAGTYPFEPMVSNVARKDSNRNSILLQVQGASSQATDTLATLSGYKSGAAVAGTTTPAVVTAGKTLRIESLTFSYGAIATAGSVRVSLRANLTGVVAIGSPLVAQWSVGCASPATAGAWGNVEVPIPDGLEFAAGTGIGFSVIGLSTGMLGTAVGFYSITLVGYEY